MVLVTIIRLLRGERKIFLKRIPISRIFPTFAPRKEYRQANRLNLKSNVATVDDGGDIFQNGLVPKIAVAVVVGIDHDGLNDDFRVNHDEFQ